MTDYIGRIPTTGDFKVITLSEAFDGSSECYTGRACNCDASFE